MAFSGHLKVIDKGSALGGKIENGLFFVINDNGVLSRVSPFVWILNLISVCLTILFALLGMVGFGYFLIKYVFGPLHKSISK